MMKIIIIRIFHNLNIMKIKIAIKIGITVIISNNKNDKNHYENNDNKNISYPKNNNKI